MKVLEGPAKGEIVEKVKLDNLRKLETEKPKQQAKADASDQLARAHDVFGNTDVSGL